MDGRDLACTSLSSCPCSAWFPTWHMYTIGSLELPPILHQNPWKLLYVSSPLALLRGKDTVEA